MIRHMRHGSPPRLMALQSILSPNRRESLPTPSAGVRITALFGWDLDFDHHAHGFLLHRPLWASSARKQTRDSGKRPLIEGDLHCLLKFLIDRKKLIVSTATVAMRLGGASSVMEVK